MESSFEEDNALIYTARVTPYHCDLTRHVKVWFTQNPDIPFGELNECRIYDFLECNPHAKLSILIDKTLYSTIGLEKFNQFVESLHAYRDESLRERVQFINLPDIQNQFEEENDRKLLQHARQEIARKYPGWAAIASDMLRITRPILEFGIYSDFDVSLLLGERRDVMLNHCFAFHAQLSQGARADQMKISLSNELFVFIDPKSNPVLDAFQEFILSNIEAATTKRSSDAKANECALHNIDMSDVEHWSDPPVVRACSLVKFVLNTTGPAALAKFLMDNFYMDMFQTGVEEASLASLYKRFIDETFKRCSFNGQLNLFHIHGNPQSRFELIRSWGKGTDLSWVSDGELSECLTPAKTPERLLEALRMRRQAHQAQSTMVSPVGRRLLFDVDSSPARSPTPPTPREAESGKPEEGRRPGLRS